MIFCGAAVFAGLLLDNHSEETTMTTTATNNQSTNTNGNTNGKTKPAMTAVEAIGKIGKILEQLSPNDRKRVLNFHLESSGE